MKLSVFVSASLVFSIANATIAGPSCDELTSAQEKLLSKAAANYILNRAKTQQGITINAVSADNADCHDYDGVHSASVFTVTWDQTDEDQQMQCVQILEVSADYDAKKKLKTINKKTKLTVEETSDVECEN